MDAILNLMARVLTWAFLIGGVGCVVVIPIVAFRLFAVLFEKDLPAEV
jgi:hypothetical protein